MWHHGTRKKKIATAAYGMASNAMKTLLQSPSLANLAEKLANLKVLHLGQVNTASTVPYASANLSSLFSLLSLIAYCKENFLPSLGNLTKLNDLYLFGKVPDSLGDLLQLNYLTVEIRKLTQLHILRLAENQLEGSVPSSIFELRNLRALELSDNNLSGTGDLNMVLLNLESLTALVLSSNKLSLLAGTTVNTNLPNFTIIGFKAHTSTNFSSMVPKPVLKLQANNFHGIIPETFVNGTNLRMIDFDNNSLQGTAPKSLANCVKLKFLNHEELYQR
ncbi:hypothetical protein KPL70_004001 [Citrus sinensis]|nr:hypothetical protein KPL70_004001 [Citrus sinensis]